MNLADQFKKGYKTTEFWVALISGLVPVVTWVGSAFGYDIDAAKLAASMIGFAPGFAYILGRSWLKKSRVEALGNQTPVIDGGDEAANVGPDGEPIG
jgi:hypothetical protein